MTPLCVLFFFFNDTATTEIYTLSLHDALPIWESRCVSGTCCSSPSTSRQSCSRAGRPSPSVLGDRKSTRLNSSHSQISYAVFCLKKKKQQQENRILVRRLLPLSHRVIIKVHCR